MSRNDLVKLAFNHEITKKTVSSIFFCNLMKVTGFLCQFVGKLSLLTTNYFYQVNQGVSHDPQ
jgi:hypothetical protein